MALASPAVVARRVRLAIPRVDERLVVCAAALACVPLSFLVYWPFLREYFVTDDFVILLAVRDHPWHQVIWRAFTFPEATPTEAATGAWRPIADLSFWFLSPFGLNAVPYHITSFLMHGLVGGLSVVLLWRLSGRVLPAVCSGLVFVAAPTSDFLVTWNVELVELVEVGAILAALLAFHGYLVASERRAGLVIIASLCAVLAVLTKETALLLLVLLPALVLFAHLTETLRRTRGEVLAGLLAPLSVVVAYGALLTVLQIGQDEPTNQLNAGSPQRFWDYLRWVIFPYRFGDFMVARSFGVGALSVLGIALVVTRRYLLAGLLVWMVLALLPFLTIGIVELRYSYFAALPFVAFIAFGVDAVLQLLPRRVAPIGPVVLGGLAIAAVIAGASQVRDQQFYVTSQAQAYSVMIDDVRLRCGHMAPGEHLYVVGGPVFDPYMLNVPAAINLYYDRVYAGAVAELPPLAAFVEDKCVIQYDAATGRYTRVG